MSASALVDRLASLSGLAGVPREEIVWLAENGTLRSHRAGFVIAPKGKKIDHLWIVLAGRMSIRVDRGAGPRQVMQWNTGDIGGLLPYSRMTSPPGNSRTDEPTELLGIHQDRFPDLIHLCPVFTARTVHLMLDRARRFNTSDLQDEKMISLGKLAAGLAHELNNPASATRRGAKLLKAGLAQSEAAARALGAAGLSPEQIEALDRFRAKCAADAAELLSPLQRADREDEITRWLVEHACDPAHAATLAETQTKIETLDAIASEFGPRALEVAIAGIASRCTTDSLATDIEQAATRIHELVSAIRRFTQMDHLAAPEIVNVEAGLRDTLRIVRSKAKEKDASVSLEVEADLPPVRATAGELNQVWLNLIDNALDAISRGGTIAIGARLRADRVEVRMVDDGSGIPPEILPKIFDPFFTTKPPGEGTGLGLDISQRLVRRYDGEITVESRPGRTEFLVRLPLATLESGE